MSHAIFGQIGTVEVTRRTVFVRRRIIVTRVDLIGHTLSKTDLLLVLLRLLEVLLGRLEVAFYGTASFCVRNFFLLSLLLERFSRFYRSFYL